MYATEDITEWKKSLTSVPRLSPLRTCLCISLGGTEYVDLVKWTFISMLNNTFPEHRDA